ncbi:MAG: hypothetical protein COB36_04235 [Alphaproteobacteria bacterium]|nr:MAG: hypothetical protein COB36_04235 [Alphaproteobacteria bacterium]
MNWRLLDIRIGRANRQQFWLIFLLLYAVEYIQVANPILSIGIYIVSSYILLLAIFRRARDLGIDITYWLKIILILYSSLYASSMLMDRLLIQETYLQIFIVLTLSIIVTIAFLTNMSLFSLTLSILLSEGSKLKNDYGYPPEGMSFNSMIAEDYSSAQKQEAKEAQRTQYKTKFTYENMNETNEIKPRGKTP